MIREHFSRAKSSNPNAQRAFYTLLCAAAAIFVLYCASPHYKGIIGMFCVAAITAAVLIYTKYVGVEYFYDITFDSDGTSVFVVRQVTGKRSSTLCRIDLASIVRIDRLDAAQKKAHKTEAGYLKYSYLPTLAPKSVLLLKVSSRREHAEIFIEANDEFAALISSYADEARSLSVEEDF